jgi:hypothetical protein
MKNSRISHTHLQFAQADTQLKIAKEYVLPTLTEMLTKLREIEGMKKAQQLTMHINHTARSCKLESYVYKYNFIVT